MALNTRIQTRRDTAANWEAKNPVLLEGEVIIVTTNAGDTRFKIGDGAKTYTQLPFQDETLYNALSGKADAAELDSKADSDHTHSWNELSDKPFYEGLGVGTIYENTINTYSVMDEASGELGTTLPLVVNKEYVVTVTSPSASGTVTVVAEEWDENVVTLNCKFNDGYGGQIRIFSDGAFSQGYGTPGDTYIKIEGETTVIHQLDPKFIKDMYYEETVDIFPETDLTNSWNDGANGFLYEGTVLLEDGKEYVVTWNGTEYICPCYIMQDEPVGYLLGNVGVTGMLDVPVSVEPFFIVSVPSEGMCVFVPLDDTATLTVSIKGTNVKTIDPKYIKDMYYDNGIVETLLIDNQTIDGFSLMENTVYVVEYPFSLKLNAGNIYKVILDGSEYECEATLLEDGAIYIGNPNYVFLESGGDIPFTLLTYDDGYVAIATESTEESHTISITELSHSFKQIDEKYLPSESLLLKNVSIGMPSYGEWHVTYGDGMFVAVTGDCIGKAAYSTDGINWTETALPSEDAWMSVTYGDGKFVAVAYDSTNAACSTDGITWTETTLPRIYTWDTVAYGGGKFIAVGGSSVVYSTDGINWHNEYTGVYTADGVEKTKDVLEVLDAATKSDIEDGLAEIRTELDNKSDIDHIHSWNDLTGRTHWVDMQPATMSFTTGNQSSDGSYAEIDDDSISLLWENKESIRCVNTGGYVYTYRDHNEDLYRIYLQDIDGKSVAQYLVVRKDLNKLCWTDTYGNGGDIGTISFTYGIENVHQLDPKYIPPHAHSWNDLTDRTHWVEGKVLAEATVPQGTERWVSFDRELDLKVGKTYAVYINGVPQNVVCNSEWGSGYEILQSIPGDPVSFLIYKNGGYSDPGTNLVIADREIVVHTLDEKYLPDTVAMKSDLSAIQSELDSKADADHTHDQYLTEIPAEYVTETELTNKGYVTTSAMNTALSGKADASAVTELQSEIDSKADADHTHSWNDLMDKPFYEEGSSVEIFPETTITYEEDFLWLTSGVWTLELGKSYTVVWDGVEYTSICREGSYYGNSLLALGNLSAIGIEGQEDTGEPFVAAAIPDMGQSGFIYYLDGDTHTGSHTASIREASIVKTIDPKFIPEHIHSWNDLTDKPFGEGVKEGAVVLPETTKEITGDMIQEQGVIGLVTGKKYIVTWEGTEYECVAIDAAIQGVPIVGIGNTAAIGGGDNGMPFGIADCPGYSFTAYSAMSDGTYTFSIAAVEEVVHKLDNKYIDAEWMAKSRDQYEGVFIENRVTSSGSVGGGKSFSDIDGSIFKDGDLITVIWDGVPYDLTVKYHEFTSPAWSDPNFVLRVLGAGNMAGSGLSMFGINVTDTGEPFYLMLMVSDIMGTGEYKSSTTMYIAREDATRVEHTFSVYANGTPKLPEKFLPDTVAMKSDIQNVITGKAGDFVVIGDDGNVTTKTLIQAEEVSF